MPRYGLQFRARVSANALSKHPALFESLWPCFMSRCIVVHICLISSAILPSLELDNSIVNRPLKSNIVYARAEWMPTRTEIINGAKCSDQKTNTQCLSLARLWSYMGRSPTLASFETRRRFCGCERRKLNGTFCTQPLCLQPY